MEAVLNRILDFITPLTSKYEGFSSVIYKCPAGYNTIGYGRNLETNPLSKEQHDLLLKNNNEITKEEALKWLREDLKQCIYLAWEFSWFRDLDCKRQGVIVDMIYNLGWSGFKKFKNFIGAMSRGDYNKAVAEMQNSKWWYQVGNRSKELAKIIQKGDL